MGADQTIKTTTNSYAKMTTGLKNQEPYVKDLYLELNVKNFGASSTALFI